MNCFIVLKVYIFEDFLSCTYKDNRLNNDIKKNNFDKDLMNLTDTDQQINMNSDNSVSGNNSFKMHLNVRVLTCF